MRVIVGTHSNSRKTVIFVACILLAKMVPTPEHPDPISAITSKEKVCLKYTARVFIIIASVNACNALLDFGFHSNEIIKY